MSKVIKLPLRPRTDTPTTPDPTTPEGWKGALFDAGNAVVLAQMEGGDVKKARAAYAALEARLPETVRSALERKVSAQAIASLIETGWDFVLKLIEVKSRF